ncbi:MAG: TIM barrel protein [Deltaproteobacteria bacterium]|nr:TIM barrel protein [Deltaproteobacteria bacterium]
MLRFAINTGMLFTERPFLDRFEACRSAGIENVEFPFPYAFDPHAVNDKIRKSGLDLILFDLPVDDWDSGGRGCATDPLAVDLFRDGLTRAITYASILSPKFLTCIVGKRLHDIPYTTQQNVLVDNLQYASDKLAPMNIDLLVEIFNDHDHPDFFLTRVSDAVSLVKLVGRPNFKIQIDTYHVKLMEGKLNGLIKQHGADIGHIQIGDVPGRHQPGTGRINFLSLFEELDRIDYSGYIGLEYIPLGGSLESLAWLKNSELGFLP